MTAASHAALASRVRALPPAVLDLVGERLLGRPLDRDAPYGDLVSSGHLAVDAVMILARVPGPEARAAMSLILGHPVAVGEPCLQRRHEAPNASLPRVLGRDAQQFTRVARNPRLPTTPAFARYRLLRVGMTVAQFLTRGGTRRDVREMVEAGWVELGGGTP